MKTLSTLVALFGISLFAVGCSQESQVQDAQEDFAAEREDTGAAIGAAAADNVITSDEQADIADEQAKDVQAAGEVMEEQAELQQERVDNP